MPKHQSIPCEDNHEEDLVDGQPDSSGYSDDYRRSSCCSFGCTFNFIAYVLALLFIVFVIVSAIFISSLGMLSLDTYSSDIFIPMRNESTWIRDESNLEYPPYIMFTLDASVHNPNKFDVTLKSSVDINSYDIKNENYTSYNFLDFIEIEEIKFESESHKSIHLEYNLTNINFLKQLGTWLMHPEQPDRQLKLQAFNAKAEVKFFRLSLDLPSYFRDFNLNLNSTLSRGMRVAA